MLFIYRSVPMLFIYHSVPVLFIYRSVPVLFIYRSVPMLFIQSVRGEKHVRVTRLCTRSQVFECFEEDGSE